MKIIWIDLETTGLDPINDSILEVAVSFGTLEFPFSPWDAQSWVLHRHLFEGLSPFIQDMHTKNGLLDECFESKVTLRNVEGYLLERVPAVGDKEDRPTLAGNSVHFDLGFIRHHMPTFAKRLSHRVYDVSAITLFARSLGMPHKKEEGGHRAATDVLASVEQARKAAMWLGGKRAL